MRRRLRPPDARVYDEADAARAAAAAVAREAVAVDEERERRFGRDAPRGDEVPLAVAERGDRAARGEQSVVAPRREFRLVFGSAETRRRRRRVKGNGYNSQRGKRVETTQSLCHGQSSEAARVSSTSLRLSRCCV